MPIHLLDDHHIIFPSPESATEDGVLAVGGDLRVERLLEAYRNGVFPWPVSGLPLVWWSPDPRFVLYPAELQIPKSLQRILKKKPFTYTVDTCFADVIGKCRGIKRPDQPGTWITAQIKQAYIALHHAGHAHSIETWLDNRLVGGLYGVSIGPCFFGESMFATEPDASKCAFAQLVPALQAQGCPFIDCQVHTDHLERFGAREIPRPQFLAELAVALASPLKLDWPAVHNSMA